MLTLLITIGVLKFLGVDLKWLPLPSFLMEQINTPGMILPPAWFEKRENNF
jgi:hypothetical protein